MEFLPVHRDGDGARWPDLRLAVLGPAAGRRVSPTLVARASGACGGIARGEGLGVVCGVALTRGDGAALLALGLVRPAAGDRYVRIRGIARREGFFVGVVVRIILAVLAIPEERVVGIHHLGQRLAEGGLHVVEGDPVLRAARPGQARLDRLQVQVQRLREARLGRLVRAPEALLLAVVLDQLDELLVAARAAQIAERLDIYGEERASRPELGGHVR